LNLRPRVGTKILRLSQQEKERMANASTVLSLDTTLTNVRTRQNSDSKENHSKGTPERDIRTTNQVPPRILGTNMRIK
jgi:hypothetical protein